MKREEGKVYAAAISGGKDSICMAMELVRRNWPVDYFIFTDSGVEFPECYDALKRFEMLTGRTITRLKAAKGDFEFYMIDKPVTHIGGEIGKNGRKKREKGKGWPGAMNRWCTGYLKEKPTLKFLRSIRKGREIVQYIGFAKGEERRMRKEVYPLIEWGFTEKDCLEYCRRNGFYQSPCAYDECDRLSCFCCPMTNNKGIKYLIEKRPELWNRIKEMERRVGEPWKITKGPLKDGSYRDCAYYERKFFGKISVS